MTEFNRMTILAAAEVIERWKLDWEINALEFQWNIEEHIACYCMEDRALSWAECAVKINPKVMTEIGLVPLERALVDEAILAPQIKDAILKPRNHRTAECKKLIAGLRFDGFEIVGPDEIDYTLFFDPPEKKTSVSLVRMVPDDIPGLDFREAQSEVEAFLESGGFDVAKGHLQRAMSAFQRGEWSSANGELRNFYESYLNEIANKLRYTGVDTAKARRDFLGAGVIPPFLLKEYNEWDPQKTQFVQALMNRMHPHGGHQGLSEEEDATFRLQISLITARLFLRRFNARKRDEGLPF